MKVFRAVSLFSNCGAGDLGYRKAGFRFEVLAELDRRRLSVGLRNHPEAAGVWGDLRETWPLVVEHYRAQAGEEAPALLAACPPCQGMSSSNSKRGRGEDADAGSKEPRNLLVVVIAEVASKLKPSVVVVENVVAFLTRKIRHPTTQEPISAACLLISLLSDEYEVFPLLSDLCDFGVPQTRKRTFLTFVRKDLSGLKTIMEQRRAPYPRPTHHPDYGDQKPIELREALREFNLPSLDAGSKELARSAVGGGLHTVPVWPDARYPMVAAIPPDSGASAWENSTCIHCGPVKVGAEDIHCPECGTLLPRPVVKEKDGTYRFIKGFRSSSYRRMAPDRPASTITTASGHIGSDSNIHPSQNRLLSSLECALLQTFPRDFDWGDALARWGHSNVREMIGEAVPPLFTELHGKALVGVLTGQWSIASIAASDRRCTWPRRTLGLPILPDGAAAAIQTPLPSLNACGND